MKTLFVVLFAFSSVFAEVADLADGFTHAKLAVFHHVGHTEGTGANAPTLRFAHLVPKADYLDHFAEGVGCHHAGNALKHHKFVHLEADEKLVELLGFAGSLFHKHYTHVAGEAVKVVDNAVALADFVHVHVDAAHAKVFGKLVEKGLTAHLFTHLLHAKLARALELHA